MRFTCIFWMLWFPATLSWAKLELVAERSDFQTTGDLAEVSALCQAFAHEFPSHVRCSSFASTPEGRPMEFIIVAADDMFTPEANQKAGRPVFLFQGGIHAGEIDGKDAGFLFIRDLLRGKADISLGLLKDVTLVFVPVFNTDGFARFGPNHRPNQNGPLETGWRTTALNYNLNRDYMKADAPEMRAMLDLLHRWDPIIYADLHVTDGAKFQHDIAVLTRPFPRGVSELEKLSALLSTSIMTSLQQRGHLPVNFYPSFKDDGDPKSGVEAGPGPPRFAHEYWSLSNRIGILVETHSWRSYKERVRAAYDTLEAIFRQAAAHGRAWRKAARDLDEGARQLAGRDVALTFANTADKRLITFKGYAYTRVASAVSGQLWTRFDDKVPEDWSMPLWDKIQPALIQRAPKVGYVVPKAYVDLVVPILKLHQIKYEILSQGLQKPATEVFRATSVKRNPTSYEGRYPARVSGAWQLESRPAAPGSILIPSSQDRLVIAMELLEPEAPDSLVSWGFFNTVFESKEYMEAYVAEAEARAMLDRDPELKRTFEAKLAADPDFAKDPDRRLEFFYQRHPSWDERKNLIPIYKLN